MKIAYYFASLALFSSLAQAAPTPSPVFQVKEIPISVRQISPREAENLFFGMAEIGPDRSDVFLHYYTVPNRKISDEIPYARIEYLDLLQRQIYSKCGSYFWRFQRINSISLTVQESSWFSNNDSAQFSLFSVRWLRPKEQLGPILALSAGDEKYLFITFPKGLKGEPTLQQFGSGSYGSSWAETKFDEVDENGFMVISESGGEVNSGEITGYSTRSYWNGTKFAIRKK